MKTVLKVKNANSKVKNILASLAFFWGGGVRGGGGETLSRIPLRPVLISI